MFFSGGSLSGDEEQWDRISKARKNREVFEKDFPHAVGRTNRLTGRIHQQLHVTSVPRLTPPLPSREQSHPVSTPPSLRRVSVEDSSSQNKVSTLTDRTHAEQQNGEEGILWRQLFLHAEKTYIWVLYVIFLVPFSIKEVVFSMIYVLDMTVGILIVNPVLFVTKKGGFLPDRRYIVPFHPRHFHNESPRSPLVPFLIVALCIYVSIVLRYTHVSVVYELFKSCMPSFTSHGPFTSVAFAQVLSHIGPVSAGFTDSGATPEAHETVVATPSYDDISATIADAVSQNFLGTHSLGDDWDDMVQHDNQAMEDQFLRKTGKEVMQVIEKNHKVWSAWIKAEIARRLQEQQQGKAKSPSLSPTDMEAIVQETIRRLSLDMIMKPDYALGSRGASVITSLTTATYIPGDNYMQYVLRHLFDLGPSSNPPDMVLNPDTHVGNCWPMKGSQGSLAIFLSEPIFVQGVTVEHAGKELLVNGTSAPKDIIIYGLLNYKRGLFRDTFEKIRLGEARYDIHSNYTIQTSYLEMLRVSMFEAVLIQIEDNWGNPDYTCLYRVRIHGTPTLE